MLPIAGQSAGPNGLIFFCGDSGVAGGCLKLKKIQFFFPRATSGLSASNLLK